ncbi:MAG: hypothetical protein ACT4OO_03435 [Nitrospiraceae bacterium]
MKVRECPLCKQHSLVYTGAFWSCASCVYAITDFALAAEPFAAVSRNTQTGR